MSIDIQYVTMVDALPVYSVSSVAGADPPALRIRGRGFTYAAALIINGNETTDFTVVSDREILVETSMSEDASVSVVSSTLTSMERVRLFLSPTTELGSVSGIQQLVQKVLQVLLTTPGSNKFVTWEGGNLVRGVGDEINHREGVAAAVAQAVSATERQIKVEQQSCKNLSAAERLISLTLSGVEFDSSTQEVLISLKLVSQAGEVLQIPLTL